MPNIMRSSVREFDNRDMGITDIMINVGLDHSTLRITREEAIRLLEGFYTNAAQGRDGKVDEKKLSENEEEVAGALQKLLDWTYETILACGFDVDSGIVKPFIRKRRR